MLSTSFLLAVVPIIGKVFIVALAFGILRGCLRRGFNWGDLFREGSGGSQHPARYLLVFGTVYLALGFLIHVLEGDLPGATAFLDFAGDADKNGSFLPAGGTGIASVAYLLAKVSNGNIFGLFGFGTQDRS